VSRSSYRRGQQGASGVVTDIDPPSWLSAELGTVESLALLEAITSSPTVGFGFVDRDCRFVRLNAMLAAIAGGTVDDQIGRTVAEALPYLWPHMEAAFRHVLESGENVVNQELAGEGGGGEADIHWLASFHAVRGAGGEVVGAVAIVFDVTERRRAERFSEQLIETSNAIVLVLDASATVLDFNRAGEEITGYAREELVGRNWDVVVPRNRYPEVWDTHRRLVDEGAPRYANPIVTKEGDERFILWQNSRRVERGEVIGTVSFGIDVTESVSARRDAERSLERLRAADHERRRLLERLVRAQEEERQRIARDVHDGPVQVLVALSLRLDMLAETSDEPEFLAALSEARGTARATIASLRHLTFELYPPMLDREGLVAALRVQLEQMRRHMGTQFALQSELTGAPSRETSAIAYRIAQEAITNIRKHAGAQHVTVRLRGDEHALVVRIADDGRGFQSAPGEPGHLGLVSMRERAEMAGGWFRLESDVGTGTVVEFSLPTLAAT
jgi:PAS domain S-box-containing protein